MSFLSRHATFRRQHSADQTDSTAGQPSSRPTSYSGYPGSLNRSQSSTVKALRAKWFPPANLHPSAGARDEEGPARPSEVGALVPPSSTAAPHHPPTTAKVAAIPGLMMRGHQQQQHRGPRVVRMGSLDALNELGMGAPLPPGGSVRPGGQRDDDSISARSGLSWRANGAPFTNFSAIVSTSPHSAVPPRPMSPIISPYATVTPFLTAAPATPATSMQSFRAISVDEALSSAAPSPMPSPIGAPRPPAAAPSVSPRPAPMSPRTQSRDPDTSFPPSGSLSPRSSLPPPPPPSSPPPTSPLPEVPLQSMIPSTSSPPSSDAASTRSTLRRLSPTSSSARSSTSVQPPLRVSSVPQQLRDADGTAKGIYQAVGLVLPDGYVATEENGGIWLPDSSSSPSSPSSASPRSSSRSVVRRDKGKQRERRSVDAQLSSPASSTDMALSPVSAKTTLEEVPTSPMLVPGTRPETVMSFQTADEWDNAENEPVEPVGRSSFSSSKSSSAASGRTEVEGDRTSRAGGVPSLVEAPVDTVEDASKEPDGEDSGDSAVEAFRKRGGVVRDSLAGPSSPVLVRSQSTGAESAGRIGHSDDDDKEEDEEPSASEDRSRDGDGEEEGSSRGAEVSGDASTTLGYLRSPSPPDHHPAALYKSPVIIPPTEENSPSTTRAADSSQDPEDYKHEEGEDDRRRDFVISPLSFLIQSMGGHQATPPSQDVGKFPDDRTARGSIESSPQREPGQREQTPVLESVLDAIERDRQQERADSEATGASFAPPRPARSPLRSPEPAGEETPRTTARRWSMEELEQAYGRMQDLVGSTTTNRSTSLSSVLSGSGDDESGDVTQAYERALAKAQSHMIDIAQLDPSLQMLLTLNASEGASPLSSSVASSTSPEMTRSLTATASSIASSPPLPAVIEKATTRRRNSVHDKPSLEELRTLPTTPQRASPRKRQTGKLDERRGSADTADDEEWATPLSAVPIGNGARRASSPRQHVRSSSAKAPGNSPPRRLGLRTMRSAAGRQWAAEAATPPYLDLSSGASSVSEDRREEAEDETGGAGARRFEAASDVSTRSTRATTSRSKYTASPSPPVPVELRRSASAVPPTTVKRPRSRISSWYEEEDTPRKLSPRPETAFAAYHPPRTQARVQRDGSDLDLDLISRSPTPGFSTATPVAAGGSGARWANLNDARSMTKVDIFLMATKLQAELETLQKQSLLEKEALLDALQESRSVVNDLRAQRDALQGGNRTQAGLVREIVGLREERDEWKRKAEDAVEAMHGREEEVSALIGALQEARTRGEAVALEKSRLQTKSNALANELKRAVVDLRSASSLSLEPSSRLSGASSQIFAGAGAGPRTRTKERTPSIASNGPAYEAAGIGETPIASTTFRFAPDSGLTPSLVGLPLPHQPNGLHSYVVRRKHGSVSSSEDGLVGEEDEDEDPTTPHAPPGKRSASPSIHAASSRRRAQEAQDLRSSVGSAGSVAAMGLTSDDEKFLADLESMSNLADSSLEEAHLAGIAA